VSDPFKDANDAWIAELEDGPTYTQADLDRAVGDARAKAFEEAAKVCTDSVLWVDTTEDDGYVQRNTAHELAEAIRALAGTGTPACKCGCDASYHRTITECMACGECTATKYTPGTTTKETSKT
jgi:hypothetical protein